MSTQEIADALSILGILIVLAGGVLLGVALIAGIGRRAGPLPPRILGLWGALALGLGYAYVAAFPPLFREARPWTVSLVTRLAGVLALSLVTWGAGYRLTRLMRRRWAPHAMPQRPPAT